MAGKPVAKDILERLGIQRVNSGACGTWWVKQPAGEIIVSINPANGTAIASVHLAMEEDYDEVTYQAVKVAERWKMLPAPQRGLIVPEIGDELRKVKGRSRRGID
jgi:aldehyde dehydrogenase (NAD+)